MYHISMEKNKAQRIEHSAPCDALLRDLVHDLRSGRGVKLAEEDALDFVLLFSHVFIFICPRKEALNFTLLTSRFIL